METGPKIVITALKSREGWGWLVWERGSGRWVIFVDRLVGWVDTTAPDANLQEADLQGGGTVARRELHRKLEEGRG